MVTAIADQTATVGQPFSFVIPDGTFTDDQTPGSLVLSARGLPAGLRFSGVTLSGTPSMTGVSSLTITATDPGSLSVATSFQLTVNPAPVGNKVNLSFAPRYAGLNGQAIAFEAVNEFRPTTAPAPYALTLYRDNPVITLRATQTGSAQPAEFRYSWLEACTNLGQDNTAPIVTHSIPAQTALVGQGYSLGIAEYFTDQETPGSLTYAASGLPSGLSLSGSIISGTPRHRA